MEAGVLGEGLALFASGYMFLSDTSHTSGGTGSEWSVTIPEPAKTQSSSQVVISRLLWTLEFVNDQGRGSKNVNPCPGSHVNYVTSVK